MHDTSSAALLLRLVVSLGVVLALMFGSARLLSRTPRSPRRRSTIDVVGRQALGRRTSVAVLRVGSRAFVVGVTDSTVSVLAEVEADDVVAPAPAETSGAAPQALAAVMRRPQTIGGLLEQLRDRTVRRSA